MKKKKILVTGCAGFIGFHVSETLLKNNFKVFGLDNINNYYDTILKKKRLEILKQNKNFFFYKTDLKNKFELKKIFIKKIDLVINLAAQAGVRYSISSPQTYIDNNISGFLNLLEVMKEKNVRNLIYASSSSVYGNIKKTPFKEINKTDFPINMYAVSKKTNELMAHVYFSLFKFNVIGLRFFTVYGPWGRPDMSLNLFSQAIKFNKIIRLYNGGLMMRDFTYIDDVKKTILKLVNKNLKSKNKNGSYFIFNVGNSKRVLLRKYLSIIFKYFNKKTKVNNFPIQKGDIRMTISSSNKLKKFIKFKPRTPIEKGIQKYVEWFFNYYKK